MEFSYLFLLVVFLYFLSKLILKRNQKLPPSPLLSLPILGHLYLLKKPLHKHLSKISNKYGPVLFLRFGSRPVLLISSSSALEECLTKNDIIFANRPRLLAGKYLGYNYTSVSWASYGEHWRNLRRIASLEILSTHRVQMLSHIRDEEVRSLLTRLHQNSKSGDFFTIEMKAAFFELTHNILMRTIAGKRYYGVSKTNSAEAKRFKEIVTENFELSGTTNLGDYVPILKWIGKNGLVKKLKVLAKKKDEFMQNLIEEHRKMSFKEGSKTMVDVLLSLQESEPDYYTDEIIKGMMHVMLAAGTDTSAGTMEWSLSLLLNNPEVLKKAYKEIHTQIGEERLLQESDLTNLPYLQCIVKETLRMCPAAPIFPPHESSEECTVGGFHVPRGTMLMINIWAIQNDPKIYDEPMIFKPERFLSSEGNKDQFSFVPFGYGRRRCPGEYLAMRVISLVLGSLIQCFEWERIGEEMVDMSEGSGMTMPKALPLMAKCRPRQGLVNLLAQV